MRKLPSCLPACALCVSALLANAAHTCPHGVTWQAACVPADAAEAIRTGRGRSSSRLGGNDSDAM